jgi:molybdate transport system substrate-binding protein
MHAPRAARAKTGLLLAILLCLQPATADDTLTVFAAASLRDAAGAAFQAFHEQTGVGVRPAFASSGTLARQIERGAPADAYLSANERWMDHLAARDAIVPETRTVVAGNRLVLITRRDRDLRLRIEPGFALRAALGGGRLALGNPEHVPAGRYARQALRSLGVWASIEGRVARASDVRGALALVTRAGAPLGIVYRSDALVERDVRIVDTFPRGSHESIVYPAAGVRGGDVEGARRLLEFLRGDTGRAILRRYGFEPVT